jgi:hypothetical protein
MVDVRYWHKADIDFDAEYVRFQGKADIGAAWWCGR